MLAESEVEHAREQKEQAWAAARQCYLRQKAIHENMSIAFRAVGIIIVISGSVFAATVYYIM